MLWVLVLRYFRFSRPADAMPDTVQPLQHAVEAEDVTGSLSDQINEYACIDDESIR